MAEEGDIEDLEAPRPRTQLLSRSSSPPATRPRTGVEVDIEAFLPPVARAQSVSPGPPAEAVARPPPSRPRPTPFLASSTMKSAFKAPQREVDAGGSRSGNGEKRSLSVKERIAASIPETATSSSRPPSSPTKADISLPLTSRPALSPKPKSPAKPLFVRARSDTPEPEPKRKLLRPAPLKRSLSEVDAGTEARSKTAKRSKRVDPLPLLSLQAPSPPSKTSAPSTKASRTSSNPLLTAIPKPKPSSGISSPSSTSSGSATYLPQPRERSNRPLNATHLATALAHSALSYDPTSSAQALHAAGVDSDEVFVNLLLLEADSAEALLDDMRERGELSAVEAGWTKQAIKRAGEEAGN